MGPRLHVPTDLSPLLAAGQGQHVLPWSPEDESHEVEREEHCLEVGCKERLLIRLVKNALLCRGKREWRTEGVREAEGRKGGGSGWR